MAVGSTGLPAIDPTPEPMAPVDICWLRMDEPNNLMQINGVLAIGGETDADRLRDLVRERLLRIRRFRQRVVRRGGRFTWEVDPEFDLDRHVVHESLPEPGDKAAAQRLFGELMARPLDRDRPLWQLHLIPGYQGGTAVFCRFHHAVGDGVALMLVLLSLCDLDRGGPPAAHPVDEVPEPLPVQLADLFGKPIESLDAMRQLCELIMPDAMRLLLHPVEAMRQSNAFLRNLAAVGAAGRLATYGSDPRTPFKGPLVERKCAAWSEEVPIAEVKAVGRALGGTVNDVLLTATAGALRRYLAHVDEPPPGLVVRCAMPINLRPLEKMSELGNRFGLVFLGLPVGIADPVARLADLRRRADKLKRSAQPLAAYGILHAMGLSPLPVQKLIVKLFGAKATAVMTNVPGPAQRLFLAGRPLEEIFFWVPQSGHLGLGVSILSYCQQARLGVATDAGLVPEPRLLVAAFEEEWADMRERSRPRG